MALKDLLALADDKLHAIFATKPHDPTKARTPIIKGIDRTSAQFKDPSSKGKKWFKHANGVVELNLPFAIEGKSTFYIPTERFEEFLTKFKASVTEGELDKEINAPAGAATVGNGPKKTRAKRGPMDPAKLAERNAKRAATLAAKKK